MSGTSDPHAKVEAALHFTETKKHADMVRRGPTILRVAVAAACTISNRAAEKTYDIRQDHWVFQQEAPVVLEVQMPIKQHLAYLPYCFAATFR